MLRLLPLLLALACGGAAPSAAPAPADAQALRADVDVSALKAALDGAQKPAVIDVRSPEEYAGGHVPGARNIPLDQLNAKKDELVALAGDQPLYMICERGGRSLAASQSLEGWGLRSRNVSGGTQAWKKAGYPVE